MRRNLNTTGKQLRRRRFTVLMAFFATLYGALMTARALGGQPDILSDIIKISSLIALGTAIFGYCFWTLLNFKSESKIRGVIAGVLTAVFTLALPIFVWSLKKDMALDLASTDHAPIDVLVRTIVFTFNDYRYTFNKGEGLAILLSAVVGYWIARDAKSI